MRAWRLETAVPADGVLRLQPDSFRAGDEVEVIVLERPAKAKGEDWRKLKGSVLRYDDPTEPVGVEDWEALK